MTKTYRNFSISEEYLTVKLENTVFWVSNMLRRVRKNVHTVAIFTLVMFCVVLTGSGQSLLPSTTLQDSFQGYSDVAEGWKSRWEKNTLSVCSSDQSVAVAYSGASEDTTANRTLNINPLSNTSGNKMNGFVSKYKMTFQDSFVHSEVVPTIDSFVTILSVGTDCNNWYRIYKKGNTLTFQSKTNGETVNNIGSITYDSTQHRYWRIRHNPVTNKILYETGAFESNVVEEVEKERRLVWTQKSETTVNFSLSEVRFEIAGGTDSSVPVSEIIKFDNFLFDSNDSGVIAPKQEVETDYPTNLGGNIVNITNCDSLQTAFDNAEPGDTILIAPSLVCIGNYNLPAKSNPNNKYIVIRSASNEFENTGLLKPGNRVNGENETHRQNMPKLFSNNVAAVITFPPASSYYRIVGIEFGLSEDISEGNINNGLIRMDPFSNQVNHIVIDRCYINGGLNLYPSGQPRKNLQRAIALNGSNLAVIDSYISNILAKGTQNQGIAIWSGTGPIKIENNYIEAIAQNILIGGAETATVNQSVSDVVIRRNFFEKRDDLYKAYGCSEPISLENCPEFAPTNGIELKQGLRVEITDNIFEQTKAGVFIRGAADPNCPMCLTEHILLKNNKFLNVNLPLEMITETVNEYSGEPTHWYASHITVENNLAYFTNLTSNLIGFDSSIGLGGRGDIASFKIIHNTYESSRQWISADAGGIRLPYFEMRDNLFEKRDYGMGYEKPINFNSDFFPYIFRKNVLVNNTEFTEYSISDEDLKSTYPCTTISSFCNEIGFLIVSDWGNDSLNDNVGFVESNITTRRTTGNYRLSNNSSFKNAATDGKDIGVDQDQLEAAICGTLTGIWDNCGSGQSPSSQTAYPGPSTPILPAEIEAENFDKGGQGVAYNDTLGDTSSSIYRSNPTEGVDIQARSTASNGYSVFEATAGEWLEYTVNVPNAGVYSLGVTYSSEFNNGKFHVEVDGVDVTGQMTASSTGNWGNFQTVTKNGVNMSAGMHIVRLVLDTNSPDGCNCIVANFDKITFAVDSSTSNVVWQNVQGTSSSGGNIRHDGTTYFGIATSQQTISAGQFVEWTYVEPANSFVGLLSNGTATSDTRQQDLAYSYEGDIRELGVYKTDGPAVAVGDRIRIEISSTGVVSFKKNGELFYTSETPANGTYQLFILIQEVAGSGIDNAVVGTL